MTEGMRKSMSAASLAALALLAACGGGGGDGGDNQSVAATTTSTQPTSTSPTSSVSLAAVDNFTFAGTLTGTGNGLWSGNDGASDGGDGDGGGAAGDGEFVKLNMRFPYAGSSTGTLKWTVLRSQFGITGRSGSLTITQDRSGAGGYKVTAVNGVASDVRPTQGNFFVSASGQINGTLPLPLGANGAVKDALFNGVRFSDAKSSAVDFSDWVGEYRFGAMKAVAGTGAQADVGIGVISLNANGSGRICSGSFSFSGNCSNGFDILASFVDPNVRSVIQVKRATVQSVATPYTAFDMLAVARKYDSGNGVSLTGDFTATDSRDNLAVTGALYASRGTTLSATALTGAWNFKARAVGQSGGDASALVAVAPVGNTMKMRFSNAASATGCSNDVAENNTVSSGPVAGVLQAIDTRPTATPGYFIQLDADTLVVADPASSTEVIGLMRRYATNPTKAPCQPY